MKYQNFSILVIFFITFNSLAYSSNFPQHAPLQFFGDTFITKYSLDFTETTKENNNIFSNLDVLLKSSDHNIVNFEGVSTDFLGYPSIKKFLLRMPVDVGYFLQKANIKYASLANNHSMDFGVQGLNDSINLLKNHDIKTFGAGINSKIASKPVLIPTSNGLTCVLSFSRTLPSSFWATANSPGTANLDFAETAKHIKLCTEKAYFTVVSFHWGQEGSSKPKDYQRALAKTSIDAGADLVIGHHPHVIQEIEVYKNKPIFYSLGNFIFATNTLKNPQEGLSVRVALDNNKQAVYELVPINVHMYSIKYLARLYGENEKNPLEKFVPKEFCKKHFNQFLKATTYQCKF